jgi:hypothetical protein
MFQQTFALLILLLFLAKIVNQKQKHQISRNEYRFWLAFWVLSALAIVFLKDIDRAAADLGFSGSGINILFYVGVMVLFYFIFKLRLQIAKMDKNLTDLTREISLLKAEKNNKD